MGTRNSVFKEEELENYQDLTYLSRKEILHIYDRFIGIGKDVSRSTRLPKEVVSWLPELATNPFRDRIVSVFSDDGDSITFEDFLDMASVFSKNAPGSVKVFIMAAFCTVHAALNFTTLHFSPLKS